MHEMFLVQPLQGLFNPRVSAMETPVSYRSLSQILNEECQPWGSGFQASPWTAFASPAHS